MDPASIPVWAQTGGLLAFATLVWFELRAQRLEIRTLSGAVTALLERARVSDDLTPTHGTPLEGGYRRPHTPVRGIDVVKIPVARARTRSDDNDR